MADPEHLEILKQGVEVWNAWRMEDAVLPDLSNANLSELLNGARLIDASFNGANLNGANLSGLNLYRATFVLAELDESDLSRAKLSQSDMRSAGLTKTNLVEADFSYANLGSANLTDANLSGGMFQGAHFDGANLTRANLNGANLNGADLSFADLNGADLSKANLSRTTLVETILKDATISGCHVYGISAWNIWVTKNTIQTDLVITAEGEPEVTVDNIEVAQFVYLLLHNEKIRDVIDTVGKKGVLLLGRFTEGRIAVLERLREELRKRGYLPIVFNFDKPETKDFTETVRLLAGLSKFVIADLSSPKSAPYELGAIVSQTMIPFQPIIAAGETSFAMLEDLWINYPDRVFQPIAYQSVDRLIETLDTEIIGPAVARFNELVLRKPSE